MSHESSYFAVNEAHLRAVKLFPLISVDDQIMAGSPCIAGTRIPVYMVMGALMETGSIEGVLTHYPRLNEAQVKDAIGFAGVVVECNFERRKDEDV